MDKYCAMIQNLVEVNAQFIGHAFAGGGFHEFELFPGDPWHCAGYRVVRDINYAYDCAGLRRPIIQGFAGEVVELNNFANADTLLQVNDPNDPCDDTFADGIDRHIPQDFIEAFFKAFHQYEYEPDPDNPQHSFHDYYFDGTAPRCNRFFDANRMMLDGRVDIAKLEAKMWFYYQATTMIDMGYTAIHMGIYSLYAGSDNPDHDHLHELTDAIRAYAKSIGSFVLLSSEPLYNDNVDNGQNDDNVDNGESPKWHGTNQLIFDFDQRAMRPREISEDEQVWGDGNGCSGPIDPNAAALFSSPSSPCFNVDFPAVIDPCTIQSAGGTNGGISPLGCEYEHVPYLVHWDGFGGPENPGVASPQTTPNSPNEMVSTLTWGYNDHRWFSLLPQECRKAWFEHFYCDRNNYLGGHGFLLVPGIISIAYTQPSDTAFYSEKLLMADDPAFTEMIEGLFEVDINDPNQRPEIILEEHCLEQDDCEQYCNGIPAGSHKVWKTAQKYYVIKVGNRNCSSTYSIHVKDPNGKWLPQEIGDEYILYPTMSGLYQIGIREDNLSFPPSTHGTREVWDSFPLEARCCLKIVEINKCFYAAFDVNTTCISETNDKITYEFEATANDVTTNISDVRGVSKDCRLISITPSPSYQAKGVIDVYNKANPQIDLLVKCVNAYQNGDVLIRQNLTRCPANANRSNSVTAEIKEPGTISLVPNPNAGIFELNVKIQSVSNIYIEIFDYLGRTISTFGKTTEQSRNAIPVDLTSLPSGVYLVKVSSDLNESLFVKFVKE